MKPLAKGLLIGCGVLVLLGLMLVGAGAWLYKTQGPALMASGKQAMAEGARAGATTSGPQCVDDAFARYKRQPGFTGGVTTRLWLEGCLQASPSGHDACAGVPAESAFSGSVGWRVDQCQARGLGSDQVCSSVLAGVQHFCDSPVKPAH